MFDSLTSQSSSSFCGKSSRDASRQSSSPYPPPNNINLTKTETAKRNIESAKDEIDSPQKTSKKEERKSSSSLNETSNNEEEGDEDISRHRSEKNESSNSDVKSKKKETDDVIKNSSFNQSDISVKRQKFVRQKSFEIDSDETDIESIVEQSRIEKVEKNSKKTKVENGTQTIEKSFLAKLEKPSKPSKSAKVHGTKKRPDLTIKIYDSSFDAGAADPDPVAEAFRSPSLHISGISINRSPPCVPNPSANLSPKYQIHMPPNGGGHSAVLTVAPVNRNR